ncbi:MAG: YbaN family protein [Lachnospiraceae bacterium]
MKFIKKYILIVIGSISVFLGFIGIFLPVLPTTPFLLLAAYCFLRSSKKLYDWLINHKVLGVFIHSYLTYKAIPKKTKIGALIFLWGTLILSMLLMDSLHLRIFLILVGIGVSIHLLRLRTMSKEQMEKLRNEYDKEVYN